MVSYLAALLFIYLTFLLARREDRRARQAFASRLGSVYRTRGEFWRLYAWARDARQRGDVKAAARFGERAAALVPGITGESTALRRDHPALAGELGWTAGMLDDELADVGRAVAWPEGDFERWITGRGRPPVESVLRPPPTIEDDALTRRVHTVAGMVLGAAGGFAAWMVAYRTDPDAPLAALAFLVVVGAAVLGHVAGAMRDTTWSALARGFRYRRWWAGPI